MIFYRQKFPPASCKRGLKRISWWLINLVTVHLFWNLLLSHPTYKRGSMCQACSCRLWCWSFSAWLKIIKDMKIYSLQTPLKSLGDNNSKMLVNRASFEIWFSPVCAHFKNYLYTQRQRNHIPSFSKLFRTATFSPRRDSWPGRVIKAVLSQTTAGSSINTQSGNLSSASTSVTSSPKSFNIDT